MQGPGPCSSRLAVQAALGRATGFEASQTGSAESKERTKAAELAVTAAGSRLLVSFQRWRCSCSCSRWTCCLELLKDCSCSLYHPFPDAMAEPLCLSRWG